MTGVTDVKQRKKSLVKSDKKDELKESVEPLMPIPEDKKHNNNNNMMNSSVLNNVLPAPVHNKREDKKRESVEVKEALQRDEPLIDFAPVPQPLPAPPQPLPEQPQPNNNLPAPSNRSKRKKSKSKSPENAPRNDISQSVLMKDAFDTL